MSGGVLRTDAAAAYCGISTKTLRNLISLGEGPRRFKHGRLNAFRREDLDEFLARRLTPAEKPERAA